MKLPRCCGTCQSRLTRPEIRHARRIVSGESTLVRIVFGQLSIVRFYNVLTSGIPFSPTVCRICRRPALKIVFLVCTASLILVGCEQKAAIIPGGPPVVSVVTVLQEDVPLTSDWVASLDGFVNAQIQPQVSGYLIRQNYREGSFVHRD